MINKLIENFKHIKIKKKLILSFMVVFVLTAAVALTGIVSLINTRASFSYMINNPHDRFRYYADAKYQLMSVRRDFIFMTVFAGEERALNERLGLSNYAIEKFIKDLETVKVSLHKDKLLEIESKNNQIDAIDYMISGAHIFRDNHLVPFNEEMKKNELSRAETQAELYRGIAIINPFVEMLDEILVSAEIAMRNTQASSNAFSLNMLWLLVAIAFVSAGISLFLALFIAKMISKPIVKLVEIADNVVDGNLDVKINIESQDETGMLSRRFSHVVSVINMFVKDLDDLGYAFKVDGDTTVRLNESQYKGAYANVASAMNDILEYHVVSKDEILECISRIVDGEHDAPLRQFPGRESLINMSVDLLRINVSKMEHIMKQKADSDAANKAKSTFLANMSHEIRTPMNAILGITEILLQSDQLSGEVENGLGKIYDSCDLLLGIINDILDFSKIEAGKLDIVPAQYNVARFINDAIQLNMMRIDSKPIEFELIVDENIPALLIGDELRIKQILNNLLSNAFKYTDAGKVTLSISFMPLKEEGIMFVVSVKDTGHGMTQEQLERLFVEYSRFHQKIDSTIEGTGLGLSITLNLVKLMGGDIKVESEPGQGSEFTIEFPQMTVNSEILGKDAAESLRQFRLNKLECRKRSQIVRDPMPYGNILVVDDVETNLLIAEGLMKLYRLQIETVMSGKIAIEKIKEGKVYDIVFMDHMMPEMDGIETVKCLRDFGYNYPIVALTANAVSGQADMFLKNGFDNFISKPIDIRQLNAVLNEYVRDKQPPEVIEAARKQYNAEEINENSNLQANALLIESFIRDASKNTELLDDLLKGDTLKNEDSMRKFTISIHGIKSSLANIGETALSKLASKLEQDGKNNDFDSIKASAPYFLKDMLKLLKKMKKKSKNKTEKLSSEESKNIRRGNMDKLVFVVDDNDTNLTMAALALEKAYKVLTIPSALKMFIVLEKKQPDLILLDIEMPEMTGFEAYDKLKENSQWKDIPVVFLTGHEDEAVLSKARGTGAAEVIQKPIVASVLLDCVKKHCP
ncbi:MAG: response regulator [Treponema sp.]|jgi:signal transduction histidine kinase/CheY-like chemotaxis protein/HPt (histidine-containing phosphotransfer) domain-containing protein|nr:response regulator [Treponema sp.]